MTTLKFIINQTDFIDVWHYLKRHYGIKRKRLYYSYRNLYRKLLKITPSNNNSNMYIYINAFKTDEDGDSYYVEDFNQEATSIYFDVSGRNDEHCGYSLVADSYENWVSYFIDEKTLMKFNNSSIICHCLWEMTFFGFKQK